MIETTYNGYFGAKEKQNPKDRKLAGSEFDINKIKPINYEPKIQYHQPDVNNSACTIYAGIGILSNLFGKKYTNQEIVNLIKKAKKDKPPFVDGEGWYVYKGKDLTRNDWNANHPDDKVITYELENFSDEFMQILEKGYPVQTGFKVNRAYWQDKKDDCIINGSIENVASGNIGHSIILFMKNGKFFIQDSYAKYKCNIYQLDLPKKKLKKLFFRWLYVFIPKKNIMDQLAIDIQDIELALKLGITKNPKNLEDIKKGKYTTDVKAVLYAVRSYKLAKQEILSKQNIS